MKPTRAGTCRGSSPGPGVHWFFLSLPLFSAGFLDASAPSLEARERSVAAADVLARPVAPSTLERMPLRSVLNVLATPHEAAIFLDRRVNPDGRVSMQLAAAPLREVLEKLGDDHGFAVTAIESIIYLGPEETTRQLRTRDRLRRDEARELKSPLALAMLKPATLQWPDRVSPRDLAIQVCREAGLSLSNPESIPHDLWAAGRLPSVPRITQLTLLLAGFDLTFAFTEDGAVAVRPVELEARWTNVYRTSPRHLGMVDEIRQAFPDVQLEVQRGQLQVAGRVEDHEAIRHWLQEGRRPSPASSPNGKSSAEPAPARYTLRVIRRPLHEVLQEIERTTPYRFTYDRERLEKDGGPLGQATSFEVQQVDIDSLLKSLFEPAGISWRRTDSTIELAPTGGDE